MLREWIRTTPFYHPVRNWLRAMRHGRELRRWEARGRPVPPPHIVKQRTINKLADRFGLSSRTVQEWEQGRAVPDRPARVLLKVIEHSPNAVTRALRAS